MLLIDFKFSLFHWLLRLSTLFTLLNLLAATISFGLLPIKFSDMCMSSSQLLVGFITLFACLGDNYGTAQRALFRILLHFDDRLG